MASEGQFVVSPDNRYLAQFLRQLNPHRPRQLTLNLTLKAVSNLAGRRFSHLWQLP